MSVCEIRSYLVSSSLLPGNPGHETGHTLVIKYIDFTYLIMVNEVLHHNVFTGTLPSLSAPGWSPEYEAPSGLISPQQALFYYPCGKHSFELQRFQANGSSAPSHVTCTENRWADCLKDRKGSEKNRKFSLS